MVRSVSVLSLLSCLASLPALAALDARDEIAGAALDALSAAPTTCWREITQEAPMVLHCGTTATEDLRPVRKAIDGAVLGSPGVTGTAGRWLWSRFREYQGRKYETELGPFEARIYASRGMVVMGYPAPFGDKDIEVLACDDAAAVEAFGGVPEYDRDDEDYIAPAPMLQVPAVYPEPALTLRMTGQVEVRVHVLPDGSVAGACVVGTNRPEFGFERAAVAAVLAWRFQSGLYRGAPVACALTTTVEFKP